MHLSRRWFALPLVAAAAAAGALVQAGGSATPDPNLVSGDGFPGGPYFSILCRFSHRNNDDPIVFPGRRGASHNHTYLGNRSADADSTLASLRSASTTCGAAADKAAYWVPTLFERNRPVNPLVSLAYYVKSTPQRVRPYPPGLKMIAGDPDARRPQSFGVAFWSCGALDGNGRSATVPSCGDAFLNLHVYFPNCWDGRRLDSFDHRAHTAYSSSGRCPRTHPVALPTLLLLVLYPDAGPGAQLSSGRFGAHADFFNAWDEAPLARLVAGLNAG